MVKCINYGEFDLRFIFGLELRIFCVVVYWSEVRVWEVFYRVKVLLFDVDFGVVDCEWFLFEVRLLDVWVGVVIIRVFDCLDVRSFF